MVGTSEPYHLESQDLLPEDGQSFEANRQIDLPEGVNSSAGVDAMKRRGPSPDLVPANPHEIQGVSIDDAEAAASIHEHHGELGVADDGVNDERVPLGVRDVVWVIISIKGDGAVKPV